MLRDFKLFLESSSSVFYTCSNTNAEVKRVQDVYGFTRENLPFRYLGVRIYAKKINVAQCEALVEKMTFRIRIRSSRHLSYTARVHLINSVLLSLYTSWA